MRCEVHTLRDIRVQDATIPAKTLLVIDDDHVKIWLGGAGAPVKLRTNHVAIAFGGLEQPR